MSPWLPWRWKIDRIVAALLGLPTAFVVLALAEVVRRTTPGPGLIRLPRIGRAGEQFQLWKLRSMVTGHAGATADGPRITVAADPRVTPVGRFLRRTRLDELPQLYNVFAGHMALIGPRPETPEYVDVTDPEWAHILLAKPAIAGPTQVLVNRWESELLNGGSGETYGEVILPVKLAIDAWYVRNASPWVDLLVVMSLAQQFLLRAEVTVLHSRLAKHLPEAVMACSIRKPVVQM